MMVLFQRIKSVWLCVESCFGRQFLDSISTALTIAQQTMFAQQALGNALGCLSSVTHHQDVHAKPTGVAIFFLFRISK